ncbi:MAG: SMC-Scp complex subunit ScpB [Planctomycetota bacterium]|nr:SMC-Scp complex subunit ScpB [Planctomycetota bacterium]
MSTSDLPVPLVEASEAPQSATAGATAEAAAPAQAQATEAGESNGSGEPNAAATPEGEVLPAAELSETELERDLAALLFVATEPLSRGRLAQLVGGTPERQVSEALDRLQARLGAAGLPWELREIAGGWQIFTTTDVAETVARLSKAKKEEKLSAAGLETLAIVAYRQPVTKGEIEAIRGVQVGPILRTLVDRGMVKVAGRSDDPGHPLLYGTTRKFLDTFALASIDDLPRDGELLRD